MTSSAPTPDGSAHESIKGKTADELFERDRPTPSPFLPKNLLNLLIHPRQFFSPILALGYQRYVILTCWIAGISGVVARIDQRIVRAELGSTSGLTLDMLESILTWPIFWPMVLALGAISGGLLWIIGGWWFRMRIKFSGGSEPDPRLSRLTFVYASLVSSLPHIGFMLIWTLLYDSYIDAYYEDIFLTLLLLVLSFIELFVAYIGVRTFFAVDRWRARLWFLILPGILYIFAFGLVAALVALA